MDIYLSRSAQDVENLAADARIAAHLTENEYQPPNNLLSNTTYYWRAVALNEFGEAPSSVWSFTTGTGPLRGEYRIGGSPAEFAALTDAVSALSSTGVTGPTTFRMESATITGPLIFPPIAGASDDARITFIRADSLAAVTVFCNSTADTAAVIFDGASYLELDGLNITAANNVKHCLVLKPGSHSNTVRNAILKKSGSLLTGSNGICVKGPDCHHNRFENLQIRNAAWGINLDNPAGSTASSNTVVSCRIDSTRGGIRLIRQADCRIHGNDIDPNAGSFEEVDGIYIGTTHRSDTVFISNNKIDQVTTAGVYAVGIRIKPDSAAAVIRIFNNFIYDFRATGTAQVRAIFLSSGQLELASNSIYVNDVAGTGATYGLYNGALASQATMTLTNNIFANTEQTNTAYNLFQLLTITPITSDYNVFFGSGSSYRLGRWAGDQWTLAAWQTATGDDIHSLEGNPEFLSPTDPHISSMGGLAHQNGTVLPFIQEDIDGDSRLVPPDRGADEYSFDAPANDFSILKLYDTADSYGEWSDHMIRVIVQNRGSAAQIGVPVRLLFKNELQDEATISLDPLALDTVSLHWFAGGAPDSGRLKAECLLTDDACPENDSASVLTRIIPAPLSGTYGIGGPERDFNDIATAISALAERGVTDPVDFLIAPGVYNESISVPAIPGASAVNRIRFAPSHPTESVVLSSAGGQATIVLNGSRHIVFDSLTIEAISPNTMGFLLQQNSDSNFVNHCSIEGTLLTNSAACGIRTSGGGCDGNRFANTTVEGFYHGIWLEGTSGNSDCGQIVEQCRVLTSSVGIRVNYQDALLLQENALQTGYAGSTGRQIGIAVGASSAQKTITLNRNLIMGNLSSDTCIGIYCNTGSGTAILNNNILSAWAVTGTKPVYGILAGGGSAKLSFNSIWMNEIAGSGPVIGIADTGAATQLILRNNIIQITEEQNTVWAIHHSGQGLDSDYNSFNVVPGSGSNHYIGRWAGVNLSTISQWQNVTGLDTHSIDGIPGFADSLNLHIRPQSGIVSNRGISMAEITTDFDGETRADPPDIGADEYAFRLLANDIGVKWIQPPTGCYNSDTTYTIPIQVSNCGTRSQYSVPVRLFFNAVLQDEAYINLSSNSEKQIDLNWLTGNAAVMEGVLEVQSYLPQDSFPQNDSSTAQVTIIGPPLSGSYTIGMDSSGVSMRQFPDLATMTTNLRLRGVGGPLTFSLENVRHEGPLLITNVPGLTDAIPMVFEAKDSGAGPWPEIYSTQGEAAVVLDGIRLVQLRNMKLSAAGACTTAVVLKSGASRNTIYNCLIQSSDSASSATAGILIHNVGCQENTIDQVEVRGAFTGIAFKGGAAGDNGYRNSVRNCTIQHARFGIYISKQTSCSIYGNDIQPGSNSNIVGACYGVYITGLGTGGSVRVFNNSIHGFADASGSVSNRAVGIFAAPTLGASATLYNNFIYDFSQCGDLKVNPIYLSSGTLTVLHNSIHIGDLPGSSEVAAIYISTGDNHDIRNNILVSNVQNRTSYGILQTAGSGLNCDGNDIYGTSPSFVTGRVLSTSYPTFTSWQTAGYDPNGLAADPNFISATNLHICETSSVVDGRGVATSQVLTDIDGEQRGNPPDIGADEYIWQAVADTIHDLVIQVIDETIVLSWSRAAGAQEYHIYRGGTPAFVPLGENLIASTADTTYSEPVNLIGTNSGFYVVTSDDLNTTGP
ncbi:MAG: hypothetical protein ACOZB3_03520 [Calditrichota bacterium]